jgi:hypothetical protein
MAVTETRRGDVVWSSTANAIDYLFSGMCVQLLVASVRFVMVFPRR